MTKHGMSVFCGRNSNNQNSFLKEILRGSKESNGNAWNSALFYVQISSHLRFPPQRRNWRLFAGKNSFTYVSRAGTRTRGSFGVRNLETAFSSPLVKDISIKVSSPRSQCVPSALLPVYPLARTAGIQMRNVDKRESLFKRRKVAFLRGRLGICVPEFNIRPSPNPSRMGNAERGNFKLFYTCRLPRYRIGFDRRERQV